jgi:predicted DsbA family dithiol-disulfide isomerase
VPWTRKAHELVLYAAEHGRGDEVHRAIFRAAFELGRDIGRIDLLVGIARDAGLDPMEASTVLGVDKFAAAVEASRSTALSLGVVGPPTLLAHGELLRGFHNREDLRTFLCPP